MARSEVYLVAHHDKAEKEIYQRVPDFFGRILDEYPDLDAVAIGGGYAAGYWKEGDDVDFDLLWSGYLGDEMFLDIRAKLLVSRAQSIIGKGSKEGLRLHWRRAPWVRGIFSPESIERSRREKTPYVARDEDSVVFWRLDK